MDTAKLEEFMRVEIDASNRHDAEAFALIYADDATAYDPQYPEPLKGKEAIKKDIEDFFAAFPDAKAKILSSVASGDAIAFEVEITGTHKGPLVTPGGNIPPTNREVRIPGSRVMRFNSRGELASCNRYYDLAGIMYQLGLME